MDPLTLLAIAAVAGSAFSIGKGIYDWATGAKEKKEAKKKAEGAERVVRSEKERSEAAYRNILNWLNTTGRQPFVYSSDNPELNALRSLTREKYEDAARTIAANLAARGISDSGAAVRSRGRLTQAEAADIQRLTAEDIARQYARWRDEQARVFKNLMSAAQITDEAKRQALEEYWQNLAIEQQGAIKALRGAQAVGEGIVGAIVPAGRLLGLPVDERYMQLYPYYAGGGVGVDYSRPGQSYGWGR